ncbi:PGAM-domain-containing protein [Auricularia subglabra TFB-10046 SS5]|nr:PGAM-domain-containing protein [Auricularia subglabra TFB-10046 SS5]
MTRLERIYIARHGFRMNWNTPHWTTPTGVGRDSPLSALGHEQAEELARHFESMPEDERPTAIFSSPEHNDGRADRCLQTAAPIAARLNIPLYAEPGIAEWYTPVTPHTGLHPRPPAAEALKAFIPSVDSSWAPTWQPAREGETVQELYARAEGFLSAFVPRLESQHNHARILFMGHAASVLALLHALLATRVLVRIGCATLCTLQRVSDDVLRAWEPVGKLAHADFLAGGVQRDWGMEDVQIANGEVVSEPGDPASKDHTDVAHGLVWRGHRHSKM